MPSRADLAYDALSSIYGSQFSYKPSLADLLRVYRANVPGLPVGVLAGGRAWLDYMGAQGAVGSTLADREMDFWGKLKSLQSDPAAIAWWKASSYLGSGALVNLKTPGTHNLQFGSTSGSDTNDPLWLPYSGSRYVYFPGTSGNVVSTPDHASLKGFVELEIVARVSINAMPVSTQALVSKWSSSTGFVFRVTSTGALNLAVDASTNIVSTAVLPMPFNGFLKVDWRAVDGRTRFFTSADGVIWSPLGVEVITFLTCTNNTTALNVGSLGSSDLFEGSIAYASVKASIGGAIVAEFDASQVVEPYSTVTDSTGKVWTLDRSSSGRKLTVVDQSLLLFGFDDYLEAPHVADLNVGGGPLTVAIAFRSYGVPIGRQKLIAKKVGIGMDAGWGLERTSSQTVSRVGDGVNASAEVATGAFPVAGMRSVAVLRRDPSVGSWVTVNGVAGTVRFRVLSTIDNAEVLRIGRLSGSGTEYSDMEFLGAAIFRRILTDLEVVRLGQELLT